MSTPGLQINNEYVESGQGFEGLYSMPGSGSVTNALVPAGNGVTNPILFTITDVSANLVMFNNLPVNSIIVNPAGGAAQGLFVKASATTWIKYSGSVVTPS